MSAQVSGSAGTLSAEQLRDNATAIIEQLQTFADAAERGRRLPAESVALIREAGLVRTIQSASCGGHQQSMRTHVDVVSRVAEGCGATAWVLGVFHAHSWMLGHFPAAARADVYATNPDALVAAVIGPRGQARRRADGSYLLEGFWPFGSGSEHSDWLILGAEVFDEAGTKVDEGDLLVPTAEIDIQDDWHVAGLQGTGSASLIARAVSVPAHRFLSLPALIERRSEAYGDEAAGWTSQAQAVPVLTLCIVPTALGIARAALAAFLRTVPGKRVQYSPHIADEWIPTQVACGAAAGKIHAAELLLYRVADDIDGYAAAGEPMPLELRARIRMDCALVVRLLLEAVEALYLYAGASALSLKNTLQRASRDMHAINMHGLLFFDTSAELYGRVLLGKGPNTPIL